MKVNFFNNTIIQNINELEETINFILHIINPNIEDFNIYIQKLNKIENDTFLLKITDLVDIISDVKKVFYFIEKNNYSFFEFKHNLYITLNELKNIYIYFNKNNSNEKNTHFNKHFKKLIKYNNELIKILNLKNKNKKYYFINFYLDDKIPYFYLSRRSILLNLNEFGKPYNFIPNSLDDDSYTNFLFDFKVEKDFKIKEFIKNLKEQDEAIIDFKIHKVNLKNNIYNIQFFIDRDTNENCCLFFENLKFIELIHYKDFYDAYIEANNQKYILDNILSIKDYSIDLISIKKINDRQVKIYLPSGLNKNNITKIKNILKNVLIDKQISYIFYSGNIDFFGLQMLEYLQKRYKIEYGNLQ